MNECKTQLTWEEEGPIFKCQKEKRHRGSHEYRGFEGNQHFVIKWWPKVHMSNIVKRSKEKV